MSFIISIEFPSNSQAPVNAQDENSTDQRSRISKIAIGFFGFIIGTPIISFIYDRLIQVLNTKGLIKTGDGVIELLKRINNIPSAFKRVMVKTLLVVYGVIIGPILEEWFFRSKLFTFIKDRFSQPDKPLCVFLRILANGLFFGMCHLDPSLGWMNLPIFVATSLAGCLLASLREYTHDITASSTAHILNNAVAFIQVFYLGLI